MKNVKYYQQLSANNFEAINKIKIFLQKNYTQTNFRGITKDGYSITSKNQN